MKILQISECFPARDNPTRCRFVPDHANALSELCDVEMIVPVRLVPPKEALMKGLKGISEWKESVLSDPCEKWSFEVRPMRYFSLPRPFLEPLDVKLVSFLYKDVISAHAGRFKADAMICHWLRPWAYAAGIAARELGIPLIIDHHEDIPTMKELFPDSYKKFLDLFRLSDSVIVHSTRNRKELEDEASFNGMIYTIYLGQSLPVLEKERKFASGKPSLVCISHLHERRKSIDVLIRAASILKGRTEFSLKIAGDGILRKEYEALAVSLGLKEEIKFCGNADEVLKRKLLDESDIFILPSFPEAFGIVITEAMARGVPVITPEGNGGGEEIAILGYPAVTALPGSPEDLADKIIDLLNDTNRMKCMSEAGRNLAGQHFTWRNNAAETLGAVKETVMKHRSIHVRN